MSGADRVARFLIGVLARRVEWSPTPTDVHGAPGLVWHDRTGTLAAVLSATVDDQGRIVTVALVVNPDKLRHLSMTSTWSTEAHDRVPGYDRGGPAGSTAAPFPRM